MRAIWSDAPPAPAGTITSTLRVGSQPAAPAGAAKPTARASGSAASAIFLNPFFWDFIVVSFRLNRLAAPAGFRDGSPVGVLIPPTAGNELPTFQPDNPWPPARRPFGEARAPVPAPFPPPPMSHKPSGH